MRKAMILAALLIPMGLGAQAQTTSWYPNSMTTLDDRVREADRNLHQYDDMIAQRKYYEGQLDRQRTQYEEQLSHERAVQYLDPYGSPRDR
jgi:hypothetical protein